MPVKKPAAKKKTSKSAAPALTKKVTATKRRAPAKKTTAKSAADPAQQVANDICSAIVSGRLDGYLIQMDDALTERLRARQTEAREKVEKSAPAEKKVPSAPKKSRPLVKPVSDRKYKVVDSNKAIGGATVVFLRHKVEDDSKSVVEMATDKPGYPKGKRVVIPTSALVEIPTLWSGRR